MDDFVVGEENHAVAGLLPPHHGDGIRISACRHPQDTGIDGILCKDFDTSQRDNTDWEKIIRGAGEFPHSNEFKRDIEETKEIITRRQKKHSPLPELKSNPYKFVTLNTELALADSYVSAEYLRIWPSNDDPSKPFYDIIATHIRSVLNADLNHPVRKELEARGLADLLKEPEEQKPTGGSAPAGESGPNGAA